MSHNAIEFARRRAWLDAYKLERGCIDCGYREHPAALHLDHRDPSTKRWAISESLMRRWSDVLAEIAKCDVRCANCHAIRSAEQRVANPGHHAPRRLRRHQWSLRFAQCQGCGSTERPHLAHGFCARCLANGGQPSDGPRKRREAAHGTASGYNRHLREREGEWNVPPCGPCHLANQARRNAQKAGPVGA